MEIILYLTMNCQNNGPMKIKRNFYLNKGFPPLIISCHKIYYDLKRMRCSCLEFVRSDMVEFFQYNGAQR